MSTIRAFKDAYKSARAKAFHVGQRFGFDLLPRHWYSEVPNVRQLQSQTAWRRPMSMVGVNGCLCDQADWLRDVCKVRCLPTLYRDACDDEGSTGYGPVEAAVLWSFIASRRPKKILQIGCGVSTAIVLRAASEAGYAPRITCVEPFPSAFLQREAGRGRIELLRTSAQELAPTIVDDLEDGLFFVDSTHTLGPAGECTRIILELLPRLSPGATAHFHDIWFPYDYDSKVLNSLFFWHESPLLHAFLCGNASWQILASLSMLHHGDQDVIAECVSGYRPRQHADGIAIDDGHYPTAIYLQRS
jgi:predicted O-methyltransferase YrrM